MNDTLTIKVHTEAILCPNGHPEIHPDDAGKSPSDWRWIVRPYKVNHHDGHWGQCLACAGYWSFDLKEHHPEAGDPRKGWFCHETMEWEKGSEPVDIPTGTVYDAITSSIKEVPVNGIATLSPPSSEKESAPAHEGMFKHDHFDRRNLEHLRQMLDSELEELSYRYGLKLSLGKGKFTENSCTWSFTADIPVRSDIAPGQTELTRKLVEAMARHGIDTSQCTYQGWPYTLVDHRPERPRYPWTVARSDGKRYKWPHDLVVLTFRK